MLMAFAILASLAAGFILAWVIWGRPEKQVLKAPSAAEGTQKAIAERAVATAELAEEHAATSTDVERLEGELADQKKVNEELTGEIQQVRVKLTEKEREIHDNTAFQAKYEKLLKEHQACAAVVSEHEKLKVELRFSDTKLEATRKKIETLEAAKKEIEEELESAKRETAPPEVVEPAEEKVAEGETAEAEGAKSEAAEAEAVANPAEAENEEADEVEAAGAVDPVEKKTATKKTAKKKTAKKKAATKKAATKKTAKKKTAKKKTAKKKTAKKKTAKKKTAEKKTAEKTTAE